MELRDLRSFLVLARTLNFTRAADDLFISQSTLSQRIARLEAELDVRLFDRTSRRVVPTDAGELLRRRADPLLRMAEDVHAEIAELTGTVRGPLRLGLTQGLDSFLDLADLLERLRSRHAAIQFSIREDRTPRILDDLMNGDSEVAIVGRDTGSLQAGLTGIQIGWERLVVVVAPAHPLAHRSQVSLSEVAEAGPFVDMVTGSRLRELVDDALAAVGARRQTVLEVVELSRLARYAALGLGAALVPATSLRYAAPPSGQRSFTQLALQENVGYPITCVHRRPGPTSPAAREFLLLLADRLAHDPEHGERAADLRAVAARPRRP